LARKFGIRSNFFTGKGAQYFGEDYVDPSKGGTVMYKPPFGGLKPGLNGEMCDFHLPLISL